MRGLNFQAFVSFAKQTHILVKHFSWDYDYWQYIFLKPVTVIKQIADSLQSFHYSLVAEEAQGCNGKLGLGSALAVSVFAQNLGRVETVLKRQKCWFKGSTSLGPAVKLQSGRRYVLWENHVHQQQLSVIKANLRSCVHLSLLGVSGTFWLMVRKTDSADWDAGGGILLISLQSSNVQTTRDSILIFVWRMLLWNTCMQSKRCSDVVFY